MEKLFTVEEAATYLRVARQTMYKYMDRGVHGIKLEYIYVGGERRIEQSAIEAFIQASTERQHKKSDGGGILGNLTESRTPILTALSTVP